MFFELWKDLSMYFISISSKGQKHILWLGREYVEASKVKGQCSMAVFHLFLIFSIIEVGSKEGAHFCDLLLCMSP